MTYILNMLTIFTQTIKIWKERRKNVIKPPCSLSHSDILMTQNLRHSLVINFIESVEQVLFEIRSMLAFIYFAFNLLQLPTDNTKFIVTSFYDLKGKMFLRTQFCFAVFLNLFSLGFYRLIVCYEQLLLKHCSMSIIFSQVNLTVLLH